MENEDYYGRIYPEDLNMETNELLEHQRTDLSDRKYEQNGAYSNTFDFSRTYPMSVLNQINSSEEIPPLPPFKMYGNAPSISATPVTTSSMNLEYIPDNSLIMNPVNLHKYPTITQRYSPEPPTIYSPSPEPPENYNTDPPKTYKHDPPKIFQSDLTKTYNNSDLPKTYNSESPGIMYIPQPHKYITIPQRYSPDSPKTYSPGPELTPHFNPETPKSYNSEASEIYNSQPHIVFNSEQPKSYNQDVPQNCEEFEKRVEAEFKRSEEEKSIIDSNTVEKVNIGNQFLNLQHSIFQNDGLIKQEPNAPDDINNTDDSLMEEERENHPNYLNKNTNILLEQGRQYLIPKVKEKPKKQKSEPENDNETAPLDEEKTQLLEVVKWFQQHQLLNSEMRCDHCEGFMTWKESGGGKKYPDLFFWKCENRNCPLWSGSGCRKTIRVGSFFAKSKLSLLKWYDIMHLWSTHVGVKATADQLQISCETIGSCYNFFREVCEAYFKENPVKLGGPGITIDIDAFPVRLTHKTFPEILVLCIVDTNCSPSIGYMEIVETREAAILFPIIIKVVQAGSIIHSKDWRAFRRIKVLSEKDATINHSISFVDFDNILDEQIIELYWSKYKSCLTAMRGVRKSALNSYLQEFMWRDNFPDNALESLCQQISIQYSDTSQSDSTNGFCLGGVKGGKKQQKNLEIKLKKSIHSSEDLPQKKLHSKVQQGSHSIIEDSITQEPTDNEATSLGKEMEKPITSLEVHLEEKTNYLEDPLPKKVRPGVRQCRNKVKDYTDGQESEPEGDDFIMPIVTQATPLTDVIEWFQNHQLLKSEMKCDNCDDFMTWKESGRGKKYPDVFFWNCENRSCPLWSRTGCRKTIRMGSFFAKSKLSLPTWYDLMHLWSEHVVGVKETSTLVNISSLTINACFSFFREVCEAYFKANPIKLGGPEIPIEINTFPMKLAHKLLPEVWVLCIVVSNSSPLIGYMEIVEATDAGTLLPILLKVIQPRSIIHTKGWSEYCNIQYLSDTDGNLNSTVSFVDIDTNMQKQTIDSYWNKYKSYFTAMRGVKKNSLNSYLQEFMWRDHFPDSTLKYLCQQIVIQYSDVLSYIGSTDSSSMGEKVTNILEKPPHKKSHDRIQQENLSICQDSIPQVSNTPDASYVDNTDDFYSEEEIEKPVNYLEVQLVESTNKLKKPPPKKKRKSRKKVTDHAEDVETEPPSPIMNVIKWLKEHKLLNSEMKCDHCDAFMAWRKSNKRKDGFIWKCENRSCPIWTASASHGCVKSIRVGSFFAQSKLSLLNWYDIMFLWSKHVGAKATSDQVKISSATIGECFNFFREICEVYLKANPIKLGGTGIDIEIDVFVLSNDRKFLKRNNNCSPSVVCIIEPNCTPLIGYMEMVETGDVGTILPVILKVVQPGSIIHSKDWKAYRKIQGLYNMGETMNHFVNFVDINHSLHTQTIETYWANHKSYYTAQKGQKKSNLNSYFQEFMWRERFSDNALESLCHQISQQYSDTSYTNKINSMSLSEESKNEKSDLGEQLEKNSNILEEYPHNTLVSSCHQISQQYSETSYTNKTDGTSLSVEKQKEKKYLGEQLEENTLEEPPHKKYRPKAQQENHIICFKKIVAQESSAPETSYI